MIAKKTMFREENPDNPTTVGIMLYGGMETVSFHGGRTQLHLCKHCFANVDEDHPLALLPDGAAVDGEIVRIDKDCIYEFDDRLHPTRVYSTYGYREDSEKELDFITSTHELVAKV